jgi:hypothetical protein
MVYELNEKWETHRCSVYVLTEIDIRLLRSDRCGACQGRNTDSAKRYMDCGTRPADRSSSGDHR